MERALQAPAEQKQVLAGGGGDDTSGTILDMMRRRQSQISDKIKTFTMARRASGDVSVGARRRQSESGVLEQRLTSLAENDDDDAPRRHSLFVPGAANMLRVVRRENSLCQMLLQQRQVST